MRAMPTPPRNESCAVGLADPRSIQVRLVAFAFAEARGYYETALKEAAEGGPEQGLIRRELEGLPR